MTGLFSGIDFGFSFKGIGGIGGIGRNSGNGKGVGRIRALHVPTARSEDYVILFRWSSVDQ